MSTPKLTRHARERCREMGISTRRAKRVVQHQTTTYPSTGSGHSNNGLVVLSAGEPEIAVVWDPPTNTILTVIPRVQEDYIRLSDGYGILP